MKKYNVYQHFYFFNIPIASIAEDKEGNIWFGTEKGVSYYDGKIFVKFTN